MIDKTNLTEIDLWREEQERKRLRKNLLGVESFGWNNRELKIGEDS